MKTDERRTAPESARQIARVRKVCGSLPETVEKLSHGEPTFFVRKKVFAMFSNNHHNDGHVAVLVPAAIGIQAKLIEADPQKFYRPAYVGGRGWVGIEVDQVNDEELTLHIREGWKLIAPQKLQDMFEASRVHADEAAIEASEREYVIPARPRSEGGRGPGATKSSSVSKIKGKRSHG